MPDQMSPIPDVQVSNVSFTYEDEIVLKNLSFTIEHGDFVGLIGANGSGKSTLLKLILGRLKPDAGKVLLFGREPSHHASRIKIAYVPQQATSINKDFPINVYETVKLPLGGKIKKKEREALVMNALEMVGMADYKKRLLGHLSGGQQQRVFIARSLIRETKLLLLDEPTVGIDLQAEKEIYQLLERLNKELGMTIIWVSHDIAAVTKLTTRLFCLGAEGFFEHRYGRDSDEETLTQLYAYEVHAHAPHFHRENEDV